MSNQFVDKMDIDMTKMNPGESKNLMALRADYKHRRRQSKHQLLTQYKSLSLIAGDDFGKILDRKAVVKEDTMKKNEFDDLSSIYTAHARNEDLENTRKRVKNRENRLSLMAGDFEDIQYLNNEIKHM